MSIPVELLGNKNWCIAGADKSPYSVNSQGQMYRADTTNPNTWLDYNTACHYASVHKAANIGYILQAGQGYACIDLDVVNEAKQVREGKPIDASKWTTQADYDRYWRIVQKFNSYTEKSTHGFGLHVWVKGEIGAGCKRDGVEVYSQERFIICTGNKINNLGITDNQELLTVLVGEMRASAPSNNDRDIVLVETGVTHTDAQIWELARTAENADKFIELCRGDWHAMGYPSQSEADLALLSMFTFYSESNEQVMRMFRLTGLGRREKAVKDNKYLTTTLKLIRKRQQVQKQSTVDIEQTVANLIASMQKPVATLSYPSTESSERNLPPELMPAVEISKMHTNEDKQFPPGFAGVIASFIYNSAPRPIKEVAIVASLGLLAGFCGKAWCIPQSGLNLYMILVGKSAVGKEAMHSGISLIAKSIADRHPQALSFIDFSDFVSGPALIKATTANRSFVNINGEWGRKLRQMADDKASSNTSSLRTVLTNLYQKSAPSTIVGGMQYSKSEDTIASVNGTAFSLIGETTPRTLFESLSQSMIEDGFLSRFTIVEYHGERPKNNTNAITVPDQAIADYLCNIAIQAQKFIDKDQTQMVAKSIEAEQMLYDFDCLCDRKINSYPDDELFRQMWNRASLKAMRISALLAVADNYLSPLIRTEHVTWAHDLVMADIINMTTRIDQGDIGITDGNREKRVLAVCDEYFRFGADPKLKIPAHLPQKGIITRKYIQGKLSRHVAFAAGRNGTSYTIDQTIQSLCLSGNLVEVQRVEYAALNITQSQGKCFRILNFT